MLKQIVEQNRLPRSEIKSRLAVIQDQVLRESHYVRQPNFSQIETADLRCLFDLYDEHFFDGACGEFLKQRNTPLTFRLSGKMTRAGGKTTRHESIGARGKVLSQKFEIAISTTLLFGTFRSNDGPTRVAGIRCNNRLQALMRVMEHEFVHLSEMLIWRDSSCTAYRFREIASRFFQHRESNHQLVTPQERAMKEMGIRTGDVVSFLHEGTRLSGKVNRITRRATVLVPNDQGHLYSDGARYHKFYVPLGRLKRV